MPRLAVAQSHQIDRVYSESRALWSGGLSLRDYRGLWDDLAATDWARRHARFCVWLDERDRVLSSMKLYRPVLNLFDTTSRITVVGAVFTPGAHRRQGHAGDMVRAAIEQAARAGDRACLLFSDIGTRYYAERGFVALEAEEHWASLPRRGPAAPRGWSLREMRSRDQPAIHEAHEAFCRSQPLAILRDEEHWEFLRLRAESYFRRMAQPGLGQICRVAVADGRFAGYLIAVTGRGEWHVREVGARGGDPETMVTILRMGAAEARRAHSTSLYAWLPRVVADRLGDWPLRRRRRRRAVPMLLPLAGCPDVGSLRRVGATYFPFQDQF